jgi:hypothetical protein
LAVDIHKAGNIVVVLPADIGMVNHAEPQPFKNGFNIQLPTADLVVGHMLAELVSQGWDYSTATMKDPTKIHW